MSVKAALDWSRVECVWERRNQTLGEGSLQVEKCVRDVSCLSTRNKSPGLNPSRAVSDHLRGSLKLLARNIPINNSLSLWVSHVYFSVVISSKILKSKTSWVFGARRGGWAHAKRWSRWTEEMLERSPWRRLGSANCLSREAGRGWRCQPRPFAVLQPRPSLARCCGTSGCPQGGGAHEWAGRPAPTPTCALPPARGSCQSCGPRGLGDLPHPRLG